MSCLPLDSYTVNFRYWIDGEMRQVQHDTPVFGIALAKVQAGEKACREHGYDYLAEISLGWPLRLSPEPKKA